MTVVLIAVGAAVGAPLRYLLERALRSRLHPVFPVGILLVNVLGALGLGVLTGLVASASTRDLLGAGLFGALTTYSAFAFDSVVMAESRQRLLAVGYVLFSLVAGLAAALLGLAAGAAFAG